MARVPYSEGVIPSSRDVLRRSEVESHCHPEHQVARAVLCVHRNQGRRQLPKSGGGGGLIAQLYAAEGQCIEVCSADQSARSTEKKFHLHFSVIRMGSRGTFVLCTAS